MSTINFTDFYVNDEPTRFNSPAVRVLINVLSAGILGINFSQITNGYFVTMLIFAIPILLDYFRFRPTVKLRRLIYNVGKALVIIVTLICLFGIVGVFTIESLDNTPHIMVRTDYVIASGFHFPAYVLWVLMTFNVLLSVIDTFFVRTKAEDKFMEDLSDIETKID
ncbi:hypothetical protein SDC9_103963 [bioreactor metagenome]|uniref:Uncharacterized protein n=1 Tax=bioreactor metagenome TaxID=1076179 RepID=A0A645AV64_9ZZZZ